MSLQIPKARQHGFTILEITVVLALIAVIMGLIVPRIMGALDRESPRIALIQVKSLRGSVENLRLDIGRYPSAQEGLSLLVAKPSDAAISARWRGPYLETDQVPLDPWGKPYQYSPNAANNQPFALYSFGKDGKPGGEGDDADIGTLPAQTAEPAAK